MATHSFDTVPDDSQAEAGAGVFFALQAGEKAEDFFAMSQVDADTVILNTDADQFTFFFGGKAQERLDAGSEEFQGVAREVEDGLGEGGFMGEDRGPRPKVFDSDVLFLDLGL